MQINEISNQKEWDNFITFNGGSSTQAGRFLQSWQWGDFQRVLGRRIWRLAVKNEERVIGQSLIIKYPLPFRKSYFYCPRGPLFRPFQSGADLEKPRNGRLLNLFFIDELKKLAKKEGAIFFRFEPETDLKLTAGRLKKIKDVQPSETLLLDLTKPEQEILSQMHAKTRYNIHLAEKYGVVVKEDKSDQSIKEFLNLLCQTAKREGFKPHSADYYYRMLKFNHDFSRLYLAKYRGQTVAAYIVIYFGGVATYVHGASSRQYKQAMAPHLLHWEIIKQAKERGFQFYDFWGISEKNWPSLTRFKSSFGGQRVAYPGTFDLPICRFWYYLYRIGRGIKM